MASGVGVHDDCLEHYQSLKLKKSYKYLIFTLSDDLTQVVVEKKGEPSATYDDLINDLPENECRYAVFDFNFERDDGSKREKLIFISWSPDIAKTKQKMLFASSKTALRRSLVGIQIELQAAEIGDVVYDIVLDKAKRSGN